MPNKKIDFRLYSYVDSLRNEYPDNFVSVTNSISPDRGFFRACKNACYGIRTSLKRQLKKSQTDLFYSPANEGMLFPNIPQIITAYDLIPLKYPEVSP